MKLLCFNILVDILFGKYIGSSINIDLYKNSYFSIMKFALDSFLCWLLIRSVETYYGDSLKDVVFTDK